MKVNRGIIGPTLSNPHIIENVTQHHFRTFSRKEFGFSSALASGTAANQWRAKHGLRGDIAKLLHDRVVIGGVWCMRAANASPIRWLHSAIPFWYRSLFAILSVSYTVGLRF
jgi:hypothetical protein